MQHLRRSSYREKSPQLTRQYENLYAVNFPTGTGDLGIRIALSKSGRVIIRELKPSIGYAEKDGRIRKGDVLVGINGDSVTDLATRYPKDWFSRLISNVKASSTSRPTVLEFLHVEQKEPIERVVDEWRKQSSKKTHRNALYLNPSKTLQYHYEEDGEFQVEFDPQQPIGMRFTSCFLMCDAIQLRLKALPKTYTASPEVNMSFEVLQDSVHEYIVTKINKHLTLGCPVAEVLDLLYDSRAGCFPKFLELTPMNDFADPKASNQPKAVKELLFHDAEQMSYFDFVQIQLMKQVPIISAVLEPPKTDRPDGVRMGQLLMAINDVSTLGISLPQVISSLHQIRKAKRVLTLRDTDLYRVEAAAKKPLSPWTRGQKYAADPEVAQWSCLPKVNEADILNPAQINVEAIASSPPVQNETTRELVLGKSSILLQQRHGTFSERLVQSSSFEMKDTRKEIDPETSCYGHRLRWSSRSYHSLEKNDHSQEHNSSPRPQCIKLVIPDNKFSIGLQLETEFSNKFAIVRKFVRVNQAKLHCDRIRTGDEIVEINNVAVDDIPTDELIDLLQDAKGSRTILFGRKHTFFRSFSHLLTKKHVTRIPQSESIELTNQTEL